jgi:NitT/TauT family transport system substrate-binding protein
VRRGLAGEELDESACWRRTLLRALGVGAIASLAPFLMAAMPERREVRLAVGGKTTLYYLPLTIAEQLGYFTNEGLSVEISDFPGGSKSLQALMGHSVDVVSGAFEHTIVMQTLAQKVQAFVLQGTNPGISLGIAAARAAAYSWPKDLKGMKVGVTAPGSSTQMLVNHLLNSVGLTPDDVSIVGVGTGAQAIAAMRGGELDAISNVDPVMMLLEKQGLIRIVAETTTVQGAKQVFGGSLPAACLYARMQFIQDYPGTVQALANAMVRALRWLQKSTPEDVAAVVPPEYLLGDRTLYLDAFKRVRVIYSTDGLIPPAGVKTSYNVLLKHNQAVRRAPVLWLNETYTNKFVERALRERRD